MKLKIVVAVLLMLPVTSVIACSCGVAPFLEAAVLQPSESILRVKVVAQGELIDGRISYVDLEVIDEYFGSLAESTLRIPSLADGFSCHPNLQQFSLNSELVVTLLRQDNFLIFPACPNALKVEGEEVVGDITAIPCSTPATSNAENCQNFSLEVYEESLVERMSIAQLSLMLDAYRSGVEAALATCRSPWERCSHVRSSYNPQTGELILPALNYHGYPWTSGISAKLQLNSEDPATFIVTEVD